MRAATGAPSGCWVATLNSFGQVQRDRLGNAQHEPVLDFKSTLFLITGLFDGAANRSLAVLGESFLSSIIAGLLTVAMVTVFC